jgi:MerR family copper efflux transcriptional regulator
MGQALTVSRFAAKCGVTPHTIRYYEQIGVLPRAMRSTSGYRQYPESLVARVRLVRNAQRFGFSLRELVKFLGVRDRGGKPCHDVRAAAGRMLDAIDRELVELQARRAQMQRTLEEWDRQLAATPGDRPARLLETL